MIMSREYGIMLYLKYIWRYWYILGHTKVVATKQAMEKEAGDGLRTRPYLSLSKGSPSKINRKGNQKVEWGNYLSTDEVLDS